MVPIYASNVGQSSNIYSKYHNKSVLSELFTDLFQVQNRKELATSFIENFEDKNLWKKIEKFFDRVHG